MADAVAPIEHSIWVDAAPTRVFDYFVDPEKLVQWMGASAALDPVPNGRYDVQFKEGWVSRGEFLVVDRPYRIVYTVGWVGHTEFPPGSTRVEVTLVPEGGGTRLNLRHYGPPARGLEADGWSMYLRRLAAIASGREAGDDPFDDLAAAATPDT